MERTGIHERRTGGTVGELSTRAGEAALRSAGIAPASVDLLVLATMTPDQTMPATSAAVSGALGLGGGAFDVNAACSGFVYALLAGYAALLTGSVSRALVVGSDVMTTVVDRDDRSTAVLFGDGAGALVLEATPDHADGAGSGDDTFLGWDFGVDALAHDLLRAELGGHHHHGGTRGLPAGRPIHRRVGRRRGLKRAGTEPGDVDLFVPHQANRRIIEAVAERIGIPLGRTAMTVHRTGKTLAASSPWPWPRRPTPAGSPPATPCWSPGSAPA